MDGRCAVSANMETTKTKAAVDTSKCLVEMRNINKAFGGVHAVENVSINLYPGEVVAVLGHNGAGKSTLMKMLAGAYPIDSGDVIINGTKAHIRTPADAQAAGIESIYQTLALADNLNSVANLSSDVNCSLPGGRWMTIAWTPMPARSFNA